MKAQIISYPMTSMIQQGMRVQDYNSKKVIFNRQFFNVNFSITKPHTDFKFCLAISQIFYLVFSFHFMPKIGKHIIKFVNVIFNINRNKDLNRNVGHGSLCHSFKNYHRHFSG